MPGHFLSSRSKTVMCKENRRNALYNHENDLGKAALMKINGTHGRDIGKHFYIGKNVSAGRIGQGAVWNCDHYLNSFVFFLVDHLDRR